MKKSFLKNKILVLLLLTFLCTLTSYANNYYTPDPLNILFGTSDSRMAVSIKESDGKISATVGIVGYARAESIAFSIYYNAERLSIANSDYKPIAHTGEAIDNPEIYEAIAIDSAFIAQNFSYGSNVRIHTEEGDEQKRIFEAWITKQSAGSTIIEAHEFVPVFTLFFVLKPNVAPFDLMEDFGFGIKNLPANEASCHWLMESASIRYTKAASPFVKNDHVNPNLFFFRSPSFVLTNPASKIASNSATLKATLNRGIYAPTNDMLDFSNKEKNGKLDWDSITQCGFIYTKANVNSLTMKEYSNIIIIDGMEHTLTKNDIKTGFFLSGVDTFYILLNANSSGNQTLTYSANIINLTSEVRYAAWAVAFFTWQTSKEYPIVGHKINFTPGIDKCMLATPVLKNDVIIDLPDGELITVDYLLNLIDSEPETDYRIYTDSSCTIELTEVILADYTVASSHSFYVLARNILIGCTTNQEDALLLTISVHPLPEIDTTGNSKENETELSENENNEEGNETELSENENNEEGNETELESKIGYQKKMELTVYPNPTTGVLRITNYELTENQSVDIEFYDLMGKLLKIENIKQNTSNVPDFDERKTQSGILFDISLFPAATYYLRIGNESVKIIKQ